MKCVEYKLHAINGNATMPPWIVVGGMLYLDFNKTYVGFVKDEEDRDYYVPDTLVELDEDQFTNRGLSLYDLVDEQKIHSLESVTGIPMKTRDEYEAQLRDTFQKNIAK
jgi:hypothetical protein